MIDDPRGEGLKAPGASLRRRFVRLVGSILAAILTSGVFAPAPVAAQGTLAPPPDKFIVSPGGVDMRSGRFAYSQTDVSVGGENGLALTRTLTQQVAGHINPFANFSDNFDFLVTVKNVNVTKGEMGDQPGAPDAQAEVAFGGRSQTFRTSGANTGYIQVSGGAYAGLSFTGDVRDGPNAVFTFTQSDGTVAVFRPIGSRGSAECSASLRCGYVSQITRPDGTVLTFGYDAAGGANGARLRSVTSNRGYALLLEYGGNYVAKACVINLAVTAKPATNLCPAGVPAATYGYDTLGGETRLATVTDPAGAEWSFVNTPNAQGFVKPGQSAAWLTNQIWHRANDDGLVEDIVTVQDYADGQHYAYGFATAPARSGHVPALAGGWYNDAANNHTTIEYEFPVQPGTGVGDPCFSYPCSPVTQDPITGDTSIVYQMTPGPVRVTDALGRVTSFVYCDPAQMAQMTQYNNKCYVTANPVSSSDPSGIVTAYTWDGWGNLAARRQKAVPGSGLADLVRSATYSCGLSTLKSCAKPTSVTDALGRTTTYTYAPEHGGILTETQPAVNGVSPQKRYSYQQRTAWITNGAGGWVAAGPPVWVLTQTRFCKSGAASGNGCATAGDEVVTTYDYGPDSGPNNLNLRGTVVDSGGLNLRTCFAYDAQGNKLSETKPRAGLTSCP